MAAAEELGRQKDRSCASDSVAKMPAPPCPRAALSDRNATPPEPAAPRRWSGHASSTRFAPLHEILHDPLLLLRVVGHSPPDLSCQFDIGLGILGAAGSRGIRTADGRGGLRGFQPLLHRRKALPARHGPGQAQVLPFGMIAGGLLQDRQSLEQRIDEAHHAAMAIVVLWPV